MDDDKQFQQQPDQYVTYNYTPLSTMQPKKNKTTQEATPQFKLLQKPINTEAFNLKKQNLLGPDCIFSKDFESGNLQSVRRHDKSPNTFILKLSKDTNTNRYSQWFYFSCKNIKSANFIIRGFKKSTSLYNQGMKICIKQNEEWFRGGTNIKYVQSEEEEYELRFSYKFQNFRSTTYFAYSFPYTYSNLEDYIQEIQKRRLTFLNKQIICKTYQGNNLYCLSIGNPLSKDVIVVTARVHPGETVSSFIAKGLINKLISSLKQVEYFRDRLLIKIIPMLNPDGVINGNYRTSYTGSDLNRKWDEPSFRLHPQIYHTKQFLINLKRQKKVRLFIDIHGHSRKKNVFFYGCEQENTNYFKQLPYFMSKLSSFYSFKNSNFTFQKNKSGTSRICLHKQMRIPFTYTLQSSFCGIEQNNTNFSESDLEKVGSDLFSGLFMFFVDEISQNRHVDLGSKKRREVQQPQLQNIFKAVKQNKDLYIAELKNLDYQDKDSDGSQSEPEQGIYKEEVLDKILFQKKRDKTFKISRPVKLFLKEQVKSSTLGKKNLDKSLTQSQLEKQLFFKRPIRNSNRKSTSKDEDYFQQEKFFSFSDFKKEKKKFMQQSTPLETEMQLTHTYNMEEINKNIKTQQNHNFRIQKIQRNNDRNRAFNKALILHSFENNTPKNSLLGLPIRRLSYQKQGLFDIDHLNHKKQDQWGKYDLKITPGKNCIKLPEKIDPNKRQKKF